MFKKAKAKVEQKVDSTLPTICVIALIFGILCVSNNTVSPQNNYIVIKELKL